MLPDVRVAYVFGSHASGEATSASDVDVAVLMPHPLDPERRWHLQEALASRLHRDVDLVDLRRASTVLRAQIVTTGRVLHESDPAERALFEATALSAYARLNEERRDILADIKARGTVHG